ncbi:hypothetical protein PENSUB_13571 [Penicillium subrubescens]|uniref:Uncharacterized protein n=1 Tax=Penicillium subrubescens TaxID=1316194 RepID=A0A1Q5SP41_9EURO|nr:hypothetical protein PENSUB_13571 [Penicillium subrubescens]
MSPSTRQALRKSVNNMSDPEKVPLLEPSNNVKELEATGDEKLQSRYRNNGRFTIEAQSRALSKEELLKNRPDGD